MGRQRSMLKVGILVIGVLVLVPLLVMALYRDLQWAGIIDVVWKVLVLVLLADISLKLGSRSRS